MQKPPFSTFENYSVNPHPDAIPQALQKLKDLANNEEIWEYPDEKEGVTLRQFTREGDSIPHFQGDGSIEGYTPEQILAVVQQPSCRAVWDVRYENSFAVESYDRNTLAFWASQKGSGYLVWPRDFAGIMGHFQEKEGDKAVSYYVQTSVGMKNVPEFPYNYVRGTIHVAGFILRSAEAQSNHVDMTYIVNADPAGYLPSSLVAIFATEIPLCIARIRAYLADHGFPPHIPHHAEAFPGTLQAEAYDHASNTLEVKWKPDGAGSYSICYDKSRWTSGTNVIPGENTSETDFKIVESEGSVRIVFEAAMKDKNLHIIMKKA